MTKKQQLVSFEDLTDDELEELKKEEAKQKAIDLQEKNDREKNSGKH